MGLFDRFRRDEMVTYNTKEINDAVRGCEQASNGYTTWNNKGEMFSPEHGNVLYKKKRIYIQKPSDFIRPRPVFATRASTSPPETSVQYCLSTKGARRAIELSGDRLRRAKIYVPLKYYGDIRKDGGKDSFHENIFKLRNCQLVPFLNGCLRTEVDDKVIAKVWSRDFRPPNWRTPILGQTKALAAKAHENSKERSVGLQAFKGHTAVLAAKPRINIRPKRGGGHPAKLARFKSTPLRNILEEGPVNGTHGM